MEEKKGNKKSVKSGKKEEEKRKMKIFSSYDLSKNRVFKKFKLLKIG